MSTLIKENIEKNYNISILFIFLCIYIFYYKMQEYIIKGYRQNVLAIIFNKEWKLILWQNKWRWQDWTFVKWWIEKWESKKMALYREIYEEIWLGKSTLKIIYEYKKAFKKDFSPEEIKWKIENKNEFFKGKKDNIFIVSYIWWWKIDLWITNELINYKWVNVDEIWLYIKNEKLLSIIDTRFLKNVINNELFQISETEFCYTK